MVLFVKILYVAEKERSKFYNFEILYTVDWVS